MIGKIESADDILHEKERLAAEAEMHKQRIKNNLGKLQDEVKPAKLAKEALNSPTTPEVVKYAAGIGAFMLINAVLPRRTSWLVRMTLPFFANRYLNRYIDGEYPKWSRQLTASIDGRKAGGFQEPVFQELPSSSSVVIP